MPGCWWLEVGVFSVIRDRDDDGGWCVCRRPYDTLFSESSWRGLSLYLLLSVSPYLHQVTYFTVPGNVPGGGATIHTNV